MTYVALYNLVRRRSKITQWAFVRAEELIKICNVPSLLVVMTEGTDNTVRMCFCQLKKTNQCVGVRWGISGSSSDESDESDESKLTRDPGMISSESIW